MSLSIFFCAQLTVLTVGEDGLLRAEKYNAPAGAFKGKPSYDVDAHRQKRAGSDVTKLPGRCKAAVGLFFF
jgi:hypothetical protein